MAALAVQVISTAGSTAGAPTQLAAWATPDTIDGGIIGSDGVIVEVNNTSGGSLDLRVGDPGATPAGNAAANGYRIITVANSTKIRAVVTQSNVNPSTGVAQVGASTTNAGFTVQVFK